MVWDVFNWDFIRQTICSGKRPNIGLNTGRLWSPPVSVMKVDVEGFEAAVFLGAKKLLEEQRPIIIFEFCDWAEENSGRFHVGESQEILRKAGYEIYLPENNGHQRLMGNMTIGYGNLVAVPK